MSRLVLDMDFDDDYDFDIIGIYCKAKGFKLAWGINRALGIRLGRTQDDLSLPHKNADDSLHNKYDYVCPVSHVRYELLENKSGVDYLLPEHKQVDYFLLLHDNDILNCDELVDQLRDVTFVSTAITIEGATLKNRDNLITE